MFETRKLHLGLSVAALVLLLSSHRELKAQDTIMTASLPQIPTNQLFAMRGTLAAGVVIMEDLLAKGGSELADTAFLNHIQEQNVALHAAIIADLGRRP